MSELTVSQCNKLECQCFTRIFIEYHQLPLTLMNHVARHVLPVSSLSPSVPRTPLSLSVSLSSNLMFRYVSSRGYSDETVLRDGSRANNARLGISSGLNAVQIPFIAEYAFSLTAPIESDRRWAHCRGMSTYSAL